MQELLIGRDCRVNGVDYLLMRLCYAHPGRMPAALVSKLTVDRETSLERQKLIEDAIEQARRERERLDELATAQKENKWVEKRLEIERSLASVSTGLEPIFEAVCRFYAVEPMAVLSKSRHESVSLARQVTCYLVRELSAHTVSYPTIGKFLNGINYSSAIHAYRKMKHKFESDPEFANEIATIIASIEKKAEAA